VPREVMGDPKTLNLSVEFHSFRLLYLAEGMFHRVRTTPFQSKLSVRITRST